MSDLPASASSQPGQSQQPSYTPRQVPKPPFLGELRYGLEVWNGTEWVGGFNLTRLVEELSATLVTVLTTILIREGLTAEQAAEVQAILAGGVNPTTIHEVEVLLGTFGTSKSVIERIVTSIYTTKEITTILERGVNTNTIREITEKLQFLGLTAAEIAAIIKGLEESIVHASGQEMEWLAEFQFGGSYAVGDVVKLTEGRVNLTGVPTSFKAIGPGVVSGSMSTPNTGQGPVNEAGPFFDMYQVKISGETAQIKVTASGYKPPYNALGYAIWDAAGTFVRAGKVPHLDGLFNLEGPGTFYVGICTGTAGAEPEDDPLQYAYTIEVKEVEANSLAGYGVYINQMAVAGATSPGEDLEHWVATALSGETGEAAEAKKVAEEAKALAEAAGVKPQHEQVAAIAVSVGGPETVHETGKLKNAAGALVSYLAPAYAEWAALSEGGAILNLYRDGELIDSVNVKAGVGATTVGALPLMMLFVQALAGEHVWRVTLEAYGTDCSVKADTGAFSIA
jgi:nucleotide-binding universal stress UspA family protein